MKISKIIKHYILGESLKEIEVNRILDKIDNNESLSERESKFFDLYRSTKEDMRDYMMLSKNSTFSKIKEILERGTKIICDLKDRNGKFGLEIINIKNNFEDDKCLIEMKGNEKHYLEDRYLYNLIYNYKKNKYSLQEQDEYYEKIESK
jgi:hypothetical protein